MHQDITRTERFVNHVNRHAGLYITIGATYSILCLIQVIADFIRVVL